MPGTKGANQYGNDPLENTYGLIVVDSKMRSDFYA